MGIRNFNIEKLGIEKSIEKAKQIVVEEYEPPEHFSTHKRKWFEVHVDSYTDNKYRVQLWVLEGSNAKGYVVANYGTQTIRAYNVFDEVIAVFKQQ